MDASNNSRREVAEHLNYYARGELLGDSLLKTLKAVTGATSWRGCLTELAMLVKPHECHAVSHKAHCGSYGCEEAGTLWTLSCGHECVNDGDFPPFFCPECGAEVVRDGE